MHCCSLKIRVRSQTFPYTGRVLFLRQARQPQKRAQAHRLHAGHTIAFNFAARTHVTSPFARVCVVRGALLAQKKHTLLSAQCSTYIYTYIYVWDGMNTSRGHNSRTHYLYMFLKATQRARHGSVATLAKRTGIQMFNRNLMTIYKCGWQIIARLSDNVDDACACIVRQTTAIGPHKYIFMRCKRTNQRCWCAKCVRIICMRGCGCKQHQHHQEQHQQKQRTTEQPWPWTTIPWGEGDWWFRTIGARAHANSCLNVCCRRTGLPVCLSTEAAITRAQAQVCAARMRQHRSMPRLMSDRGTFGLLIWCWYTFKSAIRAILVARRGQHYYVVSSGDCLFVV